MTSPKRRFTTLRACLCCGDRSRQNTCFRTTRRLLAIIFLLNIAALLYYLHTDILPKNMGYYNDECYLNATQVADMRWLMVGLVDAWSATNQTFWLDFGSLLGVARQGDVLQHDADVDMSRVRLEPDSAELDFQRQMTQRLSRVGIRCTAFTAKYRSAEADLFRWRYLSLDPKTQTHELNITIHRTCIARQPSSEAERTMCQQDFRTAKVMQWWPFEPSSAHKVGMFIQGGRYLAATLILPLTSMSVAKLNRTQIPIPSKTNELLRKRYGMLWRWPIPYKWKCWL